MGKLRYNSVMVITVGVAIVSLAFGLLVLSFVRKQLIRVSTENYKRQQVQLADQAAESLALNLVNIQNQLKIIATMPEVQNTADTALCNAKIAELLKISELQLGNIGRVDAEGYFRCSVNSALIGQHSSKYGSYVQDLINDPEHRPVVSRSNKPPGVDSYVVSVHVPVYEGGRFSGTLGGAIYLNRFQDSYLKNIRFGETGHAVLLDDNGDILYHPSSNHRGKNLLDPEYLKLFEPQDTMRQLVADVKSGQSGAFSYHVEGVRKAGIYKTMDVLGANRRWGVVVTIPTEDVDNVIGQAGINRIFMVLVVLFASSTALLTFMSLRNIIKAMEVQRMKDEFISITSHQLRTPATVVKQYLGLIKEGFVKERKDIGKFVDAAYKSNDDQLEIIENILSISRLEAGHLELQKEAFVLQDLIGKITETMKLHVKEKEQKLQTRLPKQPLRLKGDTTKLQMAIENLVSNAIKYTKERGTITITARRRNGEIHIIIKDTGRGIPAKEIPELFKRFNRLKSSLDDQVPGTGLGLYLTKLVVELHGGTIRVESQEGKGSTFTVTLPAD